MYNLSEFMTLLKEDIGIKDVPLPVDDNALVNRFLSSALVEFSVRYPILDEIMISKADALNPNTKRFDGSVVYIIPKHAYAGTAIVSVLGILPSGYGSAAEMYMPNISMGSADMVLESIAGIQMASAVGRMMCHSPTTHFNPPNRLTVYNGWVETGYRVEVGLIHDSSLATIPPGAFTHLRELAMYDLMEFLYNKMKRLTTVDVGIGSTDLKIENWENAGADKRALLKEWDDTVNLYTDRINYY